MTGTLPSELANYINLQILSLGNDLLIMSKLDEYM